MSDLAALETAVNSLTTQAGVLFSTTTTLQTNIDTDIATAVTVSENATQIPLAQIATNLINTQALFVTHLTE
jgi:hypothetical protein